MMSHVKQKNGLGTCGAVAYASILGLSELQGIRECKTVMRRKRGERSGTSTYDVQEAFSQRGITTHAVDTGRVKMEHAFWLTPLSAHFPLYVCTSERKGGTQHAVAIMNGQVFDGHFEAPIPVELYFKVWIEHVLIVDMELPTFGKNK